jgi:hypothetical protein
VDLQSVRPAVILGDLFPFAGRIDPEHAAERDVGEVETAIAIEGWSFENTVDFEAAAVGVSPGRRPRLAKAIRQAREDGGLDPAWFLLVCRL